MALFKKYRLSLARPPKNSGKSVEQNINLVWPKVHMFSNKHNYIQM